MNREEIKEFNNLEDGEFVKITLDNDKSLYGSKFSHPNEEIFVVIEDKLCAYLYAELKHFISFNRLESDNKQFQQYIENNTYNGNSIVYWENKAKAYKKCVLDCWDIVKGSDGDKSITDRLSELMAENQQLREENKVSEEDVNNSGKAIEDLIDNEVDNIKLSK